MKLLLIGPHPPPHGGISVHVTEARKCLEQAGVEVRVLNTNRRADPSESYLRFRNGLGLFILLLRHARHGWMFHLHTNGHNRKSWLMALISGLAGQFGPGCLLTVHSGMTSSYLEQGSGWRRQIAGFVCSLYDRVIGVNPEIRDALTALGASRKKVEMLPAYLATSSSAKVPAMLEAFFQNRWPVLTTVLFYRPEYGFELLLQALEELRNRYPKLGCLVLGSGEGFMAARLRILKEGIGESVLLLGDVPHELCLALMSRSDAFVRCTLSDGDAISVREALSLGVPTVASDVGHRPPGALLFPAGNLHSLVSKLGAALDGPFHESEKRETEATSKTFKRLLEMYQQLRLEGTR